MKLIAVTFLTVASSSLAQHALAEEAHEHGVGWLNVVLEGSELHMELSNYAEAESLLSYALESRMRTLGPDHPRTTDSMNDLAIVYL